MVNWQTGAMSAIYSCLVAAVVVVDVGTQGWDGRGPVATQVIDWQLQVLRSFPSRSKVRQTWWRHAAQSQSRLGRLLHQHHHLQVTCYASPDAGRQVLRSLTVTISGSRFCYWRCRVPLWWMKIKSNQIRWRKDLAVKVWSHYALMCGLVVQWLRHWLVDRTAEFPG